MAYTFQNIRDETLKLLGEYNTTTADIDSNVLNKLDEQINLHYFELAQIDRISASMFISHYPVENMLGEDFRYDVHTTTAVNFVQASAYAFYFEIDNECTIDVGESSDATTYTTATTISVTGVSSFTAYAGFTTGTVSSDYRRLSFYGDGVYVVRNFAFYPYVFNNTTASIPAFKPYTEYTLSSDFDEVRTMRYRNEETYRDNFTDYRLVGNTLLIPREYSAEFILDYWAIPTRLTTATDTFSIKDRTAILIPYAVAGAILKGNGYNIPAGQSLIDEYEKKVSKIKVGKNEGSISYDNIMGW